VLVCLYVMLVCVCVFRSECERWCICAAGGRLCAQLGERRDVLILVVACV